LIRKQIRNLLQLKRQPEKGVEVEDTNWIQAKDEFTAQAQATSVRPKNVFSDKETSFRSTGECASPDSVGCESMVGCRPKARLDEGKKFGPTRKREIHRIVEAHGAHSLS
jgi:hypothetical protein